MGNAQSGSALTRTTVALDSFVAELGGDIIFEKNLRSARFLKTVKCRHRNGYLVVKIFIKPDPGVSLRTHHRRLKLDKEALADIVNVYSYQAFVETEKAGYIIRQWLASSLYDRISTRPFLSVVEKKWISFQLLNALRDARNRKISHGDIKSENIMVTSWNWIYLTDFASYKPTYLPLDDPADFSFFFDMSGRRTCYLAPERFYTQATNPEISAKKSRIAMEEVEGKRDGKVTEAMDCFSAGCVIAELFLEGAPLFTLSQLFKYREGDYKVDGQLAAINDEGVQNLIKLMINLDPSERPTFDTLLHTSRGTVFPESFYSFLHNYVSSINELSSDTLAVNNPPTSASSLSHSPIQPPLSATMRTSSSGQLNSSGAGNEGKNDTLPSDSDHRIERIWEDYESIEPYIIPEVDPNLDSDPLPEFLTSVTAPVRPFQDVLPVELHIPNRDSSLRNPVNRRSSAANEDGPPLIILALVTANIRNCSLPSNKIRALDVFLALACHLTDEAKLDRMVPYIVELLHDDAALVRSAALRTLMQTLMLVTVITPSNVSIFPEYIIPHIKHLVQDPEVSVRSTYAQCIVQLADTAVRYLEMGQALKAHGAFQSTAEGHEYENANFEVSYDANMQELQGHIQEHLSALLMDPSSIVKRAVLHDISSLCIFLGRQKTNDVLLSHMITYLNDKDWLLRYAFFESIVDVAACAGGRSLEEYILPLMVQALSDVEESVVAKVLAALTSLCELGLFQKMRIWELMSATLGFLYHPNIWIRQGAAAFITSAAQHLPPSDIWCILYPSLRHFLKSDIEHINEQSLLVAMKPPLPRQILDAAVQWAMKADKSAFWRGPRRSTKQVESPRESVISMRKTGNAGIARNRSEEDEAQLTKLQQLGMTPSDENKLLALRDYTLKLANATSSFASRLNYEPDTGKSLKVVGNIELQKLGVVPQTVFLRARNSDIAPRSSRLSISSRKANTASTSRTPLLSPNRQHRFSNDAGAPFEDLRRRLATINASASSLSVTNTPRDTRSTLSPAANSSSTSLSGGPQTLPDRPPSPTESIVSTSNSVSLRPASRLQVGSTDGQKAAPAVGSSKTNATGLLEAHFKIRPEGSPDESGRSSPMSMSATLRAPRQMRNPSSLAISTYDGQEPGISNMLENLYLDNNRELQQDFGPRVHEGPIRRRNVNRPSYARDGNKRVEANLIANISSHSEAITGFAVSPDHTFFVSSSDDKTVKVWDTARLERNVTSKPRHTYGQHHARVKCVCIIDGFHCFASAADDGSLHVVRVHITQSGALPKYSKLQVIREHRVENVGEYITCMTHYSTDSASILVYATTHSVIAILDLRTMRILQTMENPRHYGPITSMCIDRKRAWIVVGTSTGVLTLWDKRFGLLIRSWHVGAAAAGRSNRIHQCAIHPSKGRGKWVIVALESSKKSADRTSTQLVEVWDIENAVLMETFMTRVGSPTDPVPEPPQVTGTDAETTPAAAIAALVRSRQNSGNQHDPSRSSPREELPQPPAPDVRALVVGSDFGGYSTIPRSEFAELDSTSARPTSRGFVITGSDDWKIRLWDLGKLDRTAVLSGIENESETPSYSTSTSTATTGGATCFVETWPRSPASSSSNRPPQRISLITHSQQNLLKNHQDVITALACIDSPFRGGIISGDRAGVIKVWRVDLVDQSP
ncbi:Phosphoinositide 3-kinase regulatory subunit 4 [Psilocybe cubensis]|uniref:Phosphoinositide 3-kinase regulatory subunit 4 n=2 Tax=Psilocybe cubensis TaxID=181762 RepID=A0ACB8GGS0_PSICU|nr:Phosphoinositide 3-kinase regulatory subunit 4 [Psilocybe cubensis]KAH9474804.1 Phosphoinositide 3-kinase regulatory subunit 4 [Psilocybe cubensis]